MSTEQELQIAFGPFRFDPVTGQLMRGERVVALQPKPLAVLQYLARRPGQLVTKQELLKAVWTGTVVTTAGVKECVRAIRDALKEDAPTPQYLETVGREGYRFLRVVVSDQLSVVSPPPSTPPGSQLETENWQLTTPFVGRQAELAQLHQWLDKALRGEPQLVFVTGEPGIGKTTLVDLFCERVQATGGITIGYGQCIEHYGEGEAYLPVLEAMSRLCRAADGQQIMTLLRQHAPTWLVQLPGVIPEEELQTLRLQVQGSTQQRMLREMAEAIEVGTARRSLVLIVEDLHWSDHSTLELLAYLARRRQRARLLIVGTYRPVEVLMREHPLKGMKQELQLHGQCAELALDFLTEAAIGEYLTKRFKMAGAQAERIRQLVRVLHRRTDGSPLFMVNVVNDLVTQGVIAQTDGGWEIRGEVRAQTLGTPGNLRQMIERQVERVSPEERRVLEAASVAGAEFSGAAVAAGAEHSVEAVEEQCEAMVRREQFLRARGTSEWPDGTIAARYGFVHALYQEVLYERLAVSRRTRLHRQIGEREEAGYGERAGEIAAELAVHFERGRDFSKAIQYRQQAGQNALQRNAYQEAIIHFTKGLESLNTLSDTPQVQALKRQESVDEALHCELLFALGEAQRKVGEHLTAQETLLHAADIARALPRTENFARAALELEWLTHEVGLAAAPVVQLLEEALQGLGVADSLLTAQTLGGLARALQSIGAQQQALVYAQRGVAMSRRLNEPEVLTRNLFGMIYVLQGPEHLQQRLAYATEMMQLAEVANAKELLEYAHYWRAFCLLDLGDMSAADAEIDACVRVGEEVQQPLHLYVFVEFRAMRALMRGRFADSELLAQEALALGRHLQTGNAAGIFGIQMFTLRREQGRLKELEPVVRHFVQQHSVAAAWRPGLALIYSELGRTEEARAEFEHLAQHDFADLPRDSLWMGSMTYLADVCSFLRDKARAAALYQLLLPYAGRTVVISNGVACYGALSRYLGALATILGRWDEAAQHFEDALAMNTRMEARPWLAHTQHQYATMLLTRDQPGDREKARALLKAALVTTRELGMRALEERLTAV
jgi:DNA-binding winged helix-turn-helix (wHTH) protein/tetratricopeptide (TPR) repeat protein